MQYKCSNCESVLFIGQIKYNKPDNLHVFCDAYCSNEWYSNKFEKLETAETIKQIVKAYRESNEKRND